MEHLLLQPGTLWPAILRQTEHALRCGALRPIETVQALIEDHGIRFLVRQVSSIARKEATRKARGVTAGTCSAINPFLPYDPDLFVSDLSDTHVALLNKFNVIDHHLLIVTRSFKSQDTLLDLTDFAAWIACMAEFDGLGFYNGGAQAGASQNHKHLQIVPLPLGDSGPPLPIESVLESARMEGAIGEVPGLPFRHAFAPLEPASAGSTHAAHAAFDCYHALLEAVGLRAIEVNGELHHSAPYNLLVSPRWMLLVPRTSERVEGISVNALGFAGSLFVRDAAQMQVIERLGPMTVLQRAAVPVVMGQ
ncbi:ATP adenylyltransferase [Paraburkholderia sp. BL23I1N1]|uniref:ATP adenylyltransferase family protein n=1 Tax=Paraburkholderia sp. BL23I1N1 TaxID=1938802 RepID=UPI000E76645C|nr:phosphorylase [Paraburkholderia sp. BL23I1N1]RKE37727.1 ATP adenylyltransferase [Paraburkholderia sp. BL23I1N1]